MVENAVVTASEAAVSQIMAALRRLAWKRASQVDSLPPGVVYSRYRIDQILGGVLDEVCPVLEAFTRGETQEALDVLVCQGKITLEKLPSYDLYTFTVCSLNQQ